MKYFIMTIALLMQGRKVSSWLSTFLTVDAYHKHNVHIINKEKQLIIFHNSQVDSIMLSFRHCVHETVE